MATRPSFGSTGLPPCGFPPANRSPAGCRFPAGVYGLVRPALSRRLAAATILSPPLVRAAMPANPTVERIESYHRRINRAIPLCLPHRPTATPRARSRVRCRLVNPTPASRPRSAETMFGSKGARPQRGGSTSSQSLVSTGPGRGNPYRAGLWYCVSSLGKPSLGPAGFHPYPDFRNGAAGAAPSERDQGSSVRRFR